MDIHPIKTDADYRAALAEIEQLFAAEPDTPDGDRLVFARSKGSVDLYQKPSSGGREEMLLEGGLGKFPADWSPNGRFILYIAGGAAIARSDLLVLPLFGDRKPFPFLETRFIETRGRFSPDGRWIVYTRDFDRGNLNVIENYR